MAAIKPLYINPADGLATESVPGADTVSFATVTVPNPVNPTDAANKHYVDTHSGGGGGALLKLAEINVGAQAVYEATVTVMDADVSASSTLLSAISGATPTGKDADEVGMDSFVLLATAGAGQVTFYIRGLEGYIHDTFKVAYQIGF